MVRGVPDHRIRAYIKKHMDKVFKTFPIHKEEIKDISESLENLCRTLSGKNNIKVAYDDKAYTDGEKITLCHTDVSYEDILGLSAHESGHIAYNSFSKKLSDLADTLPYLYGDLITDEYETYKINHKKTSSGAPIAKDIYIQCVVKWSKQIVNFVEDIRINKINEIEYMGFGYFVRKYEERLFQQFFESEIYSHPITALLESHYYISGHTNILNAHLIDNKKLYDKIRRLFAKHQHLNVSILVVSKLFPKLIKFFVPPSCISRQQNNCVSDGTPTTNNDMLQPSSKVSKRNKTEEGMSYGELIDNLNADIDQVADSQLFKDEQKKLQAQIQEIKKKLYGNEFDDDDEFTTKVVRPDQLTSSRTTIMSTQDILNQYKSVIAILKKKFIIYTENQDKFRRGRLANNFVKSYVDGYPFIFTQKRLPRRSKISFLIDISGSMDSKQLEMCKIGVLIFTYALNDLLNIRIALFAGGDNKAYNVIIKDYDDPLDVKMLDKITKYNGIGSTPTGISARQEYKDGAEYLIVFTDGYPAFTNYGITKAIDDFKELRKRMKGIFGYIIDCKETDGLRRMFNNNYVQLSRQTAQSKRIALILQFAEKIAFKLV